MIALHGDTTLRSELVELLILESEMWPDLVELVSSPLHDILPVLSNDIQHVRLHSMHLLLYLFTQFVSILKLHSHYLIVLFIFLLE